MCPYLAYDSMRWPDLVDLWILARKMGMPQLQNHAVDILVRKIHCSVGLFGPRKRTDGEIIQMNTVLNMLWYNKYLTRCEPTEFEALKPLRSLMLDFVVNPLVSISRAPCSDFFLSFLLFLSSSFMFFASCFSAVAEACRVASQCFWRTGFDLVVLSMSALCDCIGFQSSVYTSADLVSKSG